MFKFLLELICSITKHLVNVYKRQTKHLLLTLIHHGTFVSDVVFCYIGLKATRLYKVELCIYSGSIDTDILYTPLLKWMVFATDIYIFFCKVQAVRTFSTSIVKL